MKNVVLAVVVPIGLSSCFSLDLDASHLDRFEIMAGCDRMEEMCGENGVVASGTRVVLALDDDCARCCAVAEKLSAGGARTSYWIDVAGAPALADAHPEWVADLPHDANGEASKAWPWVPLTSPEAFEAQVARVRELLAGMPTPEQLYLCGLRSAPPGVAPAAADSSSAEAAPGVPASVRFVERIHALAPTSEIVPVFTYERNDAISSCRSDWLELVAALASSRSQLGVAIPLIGTVDIEETLDGMRSDLQACGVEPIAADRFVVVCACPQDVGEESKIDVQVSLGTCWDGVDVWLMAFDPIEHPLEARPAPIAKP